MSGRATPKADPLQHLDVRTLYPTAIVRYDGAVDALAVLPVQSCGHVHQTGIGFVCAEHPAGGIRCFDCAEAHVGKHDFETEHRCDECGGITTVIHPVLMMTTAVGVPTHDLAGRDGLLYGPVNISGIGLCSSCLNQGHR